MERFVGTCFVLFVVAGVLSVTSGTAVSSTVSNPVCVGNISRHEVQLTMNGIKDDLHSLETLKERMATRLDTLMRSLHTDSEEDSVANIISVFLEYIPGVGSLYKASRTFIHSLKHSDVSLSIIGGAIEDLLYFTNLDSPDVVTVHSVFENLADDALRRLVNSMGRASNTDRVEAAVKRHLAEVDSSKKGFLLVHHPGAYDSFHNRFLSNRVTMAKYGLSKHAVYTGLISYDRYTDKSLMTVVVPQGFKEDAPIWVSFKFDQTWAGKLNHIVKSVGTFGNFQIDISNPDESAIEMLRGEAYYWYTGTVYIGDLEMLDGDEKDEYRLIDGWIDLTMFSTDPSLPLGHITRLAFMQKARD